MKKIWAAVALAAVVGLAANTHADVQNIRLSGDIRLRGYFLDDVAENPNSATEGQQQGNDAFIEQRTRVCVEADLEDHVLVVVTLKAEGLWGHDDGTSLDANGNTTGSGPGSMGANGAINRGWNVGIDEAYVQLNEVFYSAATLKLGRQYLNYGHGLILSSDEQEYNYDAGRVVLDYYPLTIDVVGAELVNNQTFGSAASHLGSADLLFVNARYEMTDSLLKDVEAYFGYMAQGTSSPDSPSGGISSRVPPSFDGASPMILGARGDLNLTEGLTAYGEAAYEFGANGDTPTGNGGSLHAYLVNAGLKFGRKDWQWSPVLNASYTLASGGGSKGDSTFVPWFDYVDGYNGYLFCPALSNIQIFNAGASIKPWENTTLALQGYYYLKADPSVGAGSNPNVDFGGAGWAAPSVANGGNSSRTLGWELDGILGYDYSKDVRGQLVYALFIPDDSLHDSGVGSVAQEVRAEVDVKF